MKEIILKIIRSRNIKYLIRYHVKNAELQRAVMCKLYDEGSRDSAKLSMKAMQDSENEATRLRLELEKL